MAGNDDNSTRKAIGFGLGALGAVVVIGGALAFFTSSEEDQLVIIKADTAPVKIAPDDPGGLKLNSIDSPVMGLLDQKLEAEEGVEILRPPVTEPELPPINVDEDTAETADTAIPETSEAGQTTSTENTDNTAATAEAELAEAEAPKPEAPKPEAPEPEVVVADSAAEPDADTAPAGETAQAEATPSDDGDEINQAIASLPTKKPPPKIVNTTDINAPAFVVQFAAFKSEKRAKNTAAVLSTKHEKRLGGTTLGYMKRGDYWRVLTEPMPRADATALCSLFRSVGQDCITKKMEQP